MISFELNAMSSEKTVLQFHIDNATGIPHASDSSIRFLVRDGDTQTHSLDTGRPSPRASLKGKTTWNENLGPISLRHTNEVQFEVRVRSKLLKSRLAARSRRYKVKELIAMQGCLTDRDRLIDLPMTLLDTYEESARLTLNIRKISTRFIAAAPALSPTVPSPRRRGTDESEATTHSAQSGSSSGSGISSLDGLQTVASPASSSTSLGAPEIFVITPDGDRIVDEDPIKIASSSTDALGR